MKLGNGRRFRDDWLDATISCVLLRALAAVDAILCRRPDRVERPTEEV
jgi:hypothetical protein